MSTLAAPASATSGLQGYNLEGAKAPKNKKTLIIKRAVRNGDEVVAWAKAAGFVTTLPADDMHVTIAYSKTAVDWDAVPKDNLPLLRIVGGDRAMKCLGEAGEAAVLKIQSDELTKRHLDVRSAGASWSHPEYQPHITISYAAGGVDVEKIIPHGGVIELGPEQWDEVKKNWMESVVEKNSGVIRAAGFALVTDEGMALFLKRSDEGDHAGEWCFPGGKIEPGETAEQAAVRETFEEIGFRLNPTDERFEVCRITNSGVDFTTFFQRLEEFEPKLDHEHTGYRWASLEEPPAPLHPGVRSSLPLVISQATELTMKAAGGGLENSTNVEKSDAGELEMNNFSLFVPLLKVDVAKQIVYGTAVEEVEDRAGEIFDYATSKPEFEKWSGDIEKSTDGKSKGNVRSMHGKIAAGKLNDIGFDDKRKAIDVAAKIVDKDEWQKVLEGVYTGFSIGGSYVKRWTDGDLKRYTARPAEISLVDLPCVPTATFSMIKADGSEELRKFAQPGAEVTPEPVVISNEAVATRATEIAKSTGGQWIDHVVEARKALEDEIAKAAVAKAAATAVIDPEIAKASAAAEAAKVTNVDGAGDWEQVWVSKRLAGQTFSKKGDLAKALVELDAKEAAAATAAPVLDALKAAGVDAADLEKRKFTAAERGKDAKSGAAEADGSYPIENEKDLENAVKAYGRSKNKVKTKRHIISRAKSLGLTAKLPDGWVKKVVETDDGDLQKAASLWFVADLVNALSCVECLEDRAESSSMYGGTDVPKELTDRFGALQTEFGDIISEILDLVLVGMREEEAIEATKLSPIAELLKRGARHSARDRAIIKKTHDHMVEMDKGCCSGGMDKIDPAGDIAKAVDVAAISAENEHLKAKDTANSEMLKDILAGIGAMTAEMTVIKTENAEMKKASQELKVDLSAIRYTPVPAPAGTFRVVEKGAAIPDLSAISDDDLRRRGDAAQASRLMGPPR